ncbi:N-methylhydantoinase (ATP-hydrolyzing) [Enterococcus faecalis KS19]|nr:N-methylhydantoinase (ATP-hydrolyzing) [Enterococcus faecalis KS19]
MVRLGHAQVGDPSKVAHLDQTFAEKVYQKIGELVSEAIDRMKTSSADVTVVLVGGGSIIIPEELTGVKALIRNENGAVANAIGASIAQISGQYEQIYVYSKIQRDAALADAQEKAVQQAELAGAVPGTIELVEVEETPLAYHPENATRLRVKVVGNMY